VVVVLPNNATAAIIASTVTVAQSAPMTPLRDCRAYVVIEPSGISDANSSRVLGRRSRARVTSERIPRGGPLTRASARQDDHRMRAGSGGP
jgi:hypothetical protein